MTVRALVLSCVSLLAAGCSLTPRDRFTVADAYSASSPGVSEMRIWADAPSAALVRFLAVPRRSGPPRCDANYLALSAGGSDGAFGAGLLKGWTEGGTRPSFDIVTGVSTGALLAPLAFLGPDRDADLQRLYSGDLSLSLIGLPNPLTPLTTAGLVGSHSLRDLIAQNVTEDLLARIAVQHRKGRRLLVVTTDLDAQRPVLWNMGAIAASGRADALALFREILLASASIPGVFPPVLIRSEVAGTSFSEMHVDGSATMPIYADPGLFAGPRPLGTAACRRRKHLWLVINNTQPPEFKVVPENGAAIILRSYSTLIKAETKGFVTASYAASRQLGIDINVAYIDKESGYDPIQPFKPAYMRSVFALGERKAAAGTAWHKSLDRMQEAVTP